MSKRLPPGQEPVERILNWGVDHPGITASIPRIDLKNWSLIVDGEVEKPLKMSWTDFLKHPRIKSKSDFHCVEGWSVLDCEWEGASFKHIADLVKPKATAKYVFFECADGYSTSLPLSALLDDDVLLAYRLNGKDLEEGLGDPLRMIVPKKYAYKSAMWITKISFMSKNRLGYWESRGYSDTADIWKNDRISFDW